MRIGIDAACWSNKRGYGRFTRGLLQALLEMDTEHQFILFVDAQTHAKCQLPPQATWVVVPTSQSPTEAASADGRRSLGDLWAMTQAVSRYPLDAFFIPSVYTYFPIFSKAKIIVGIHDTIPEDYPELIFPQWKERLLWSLKGWLARRQADYILTVSQHAKNRMIHHFNHRQDRIWVIDEAADPIFHPLDTIDESILEQYGVAKSDRFVLYLGGINPHKNLEMLVQSLTEVSQDSSLKLVIIGDMHDVFTPGIKQLKAKIAQCHLEHRVIFTGFVPDADAVHFLNRAEVLVLCSLAEGFGLPAIEAAACRTPVIATRNSPLPDVLAGGGIFIDPTQPQQLTDALGQILFDQSQRHQFGKIAWERANQFTWQRSARQMNDHLANL